MPPAESPEVSAEKGYKRATCKHVFAVRSWQDHTVENHRFKNIDLVCPGCPERGYAPGRDDEDQYEECLQKVGPFRFNKCKLYNSKKRIPCWSKQG